MEQMAFYLDSTKADLDKARQELPQAPPKEPSLELSVRPSFYLLLFLLAYLMLMQKEAQMAAKIEAEFSAWTVQWLLSSFNFLANFSNADYPAQAKLVRPLLVGPFLILFYNFAFSVSASILWTEAKNSGALH